MRRVALGALLAVMAGSWAMAQMADVDADDDGQASYEELTAVYPDVTEDQFAQMDSNEDGYLDEAEMTAGFDEGILVDVPNDE